MSQKKPRKISLLGSTLAKEVSTTPIEERLENMLAKIDGVGDISILLTYNEEDLEGAVIVASGAREC